MVAFRGRKARVPEGRRRHPCASCGKPTALLETCVPCLGGAGVPAIAAAPTATVTRVVVHTVTPLPALREVLSRGAVGLYSCGFRFDPQEPTPEVTTTVRHDRDTLVAVVGGATVEIRAGHRPTCSGHPDRPTCNCRFEAAYRALEFPP